jgi:hypothetical protein
MLAAALGGLVVLGARRVPAAKSAPGAAPLTPAELGALEAWYEALVPGAVRSGVGDYVTEQLRKDSRLSLLQLRYLNWPPPWVAFYRQGLAALDTVARRRAHVAFAASPPAARAAMARDAARGRLGGWPASPPLKAWYSATRTDAIDVVYGTGPALAGQGMPMTQNPPPRW